jgi:hypothetical protein
MARTGVTKHLIARPSGGDFGAAKGCLFLSRTEVRNMKRLATLAVLILSGTVMTGISGAATIEVNGTAAMEGSYGLEVVSDGVDNSSAYVQDDSPNQESTYRASFLFRGIPSQKVG